MNNYETCATMHRGIVNRNAEKTAFVPTQPVRPTVPDGQGWRLVTAVPDGEFVVWYWERLQG